ncbi:hypothetical protein V1499_15710 [Neobacillus sp. SCS-31]|uniref:hypothetical protein n=1 Tax=Neobacillus oceani TaxID=3115292 RepID=UPI0039059CD2
MQVLFGLASLILLLYFLPLGMTGKGKLAIAFSAALFALGGIYLLKLLPPWQSALLVIAIAGGTSLIFARKLDSFLFNIPARIDEKPLFQDEKEKSSHIFHKDKPLGPVETEVVTKDQTMAEPIQAEIQDTETLVYLEHEEIAELGLQQNAEAIPQVFESDDLEPLIPIEHSEAKQETSFLDDLDMFGDIEELLEKSVPASPFLEGAASFEERDLEVLIQSDDAELPVLEVRKLEKDAIQYDENDDYLTALHETAVSAEKVKARSSRNG